MKIADKINKWILPYANKIGNQRHLIAIRDSFIDISPIIMVNSLFILLNSLLFSNPGLQKKFPYFKKLLDIGTMVNNGTLGFMTIFVTFLIGYRLTKHYVAAKTITEENLSPLHAGIISVAVTLIMFPLFNDVNVANSTKIVKVAGVYTQALTSSGGMFVGLIGALLSTELLIKITKSGKLRIKMPDGVPPAVAQSFNSLIPESLVVIIFALFTFIYIQITGQTITQLVQTVIAIPLQAAMESPIGLFMVQIVTQILWFFGLHGQNIVSSVTSPSMLAAIQQNISAFSAGKHVPFIVTNPWIGMYTLFGGTGAILPLLIAIFIGSKRQNYREVAKLGLVPSFFNVSEPIMFGLPVVMNPFLAIPFLFVPIINLAIAYPLTAMGLVAKSVVIPPWTLPPILTAWVTTAGDIPATILSALLFIMDIFLYLPFVLASNKSKEI
ncbi:PTS sugar transporter subunit IIC [Xylocopilactobacillus apicola]|uniref:Permease IIC component n=1 Tax=Xylocopilactobacillus apicola TaxID=2932184 RepID=A0AAU9DR06_9LACO|nr:PTS transporter subunit EIIC [Xylocopilactobacillus apicola]BDR57578.1 permease IIC component [Xylocopilactobacillus apicola]